jgi:hypothetical protein
MASKDAFRAHVLSTDIGCRPAEPCTISVAATHQLLTQLFLYIAQIIFEDDTLQRTIGSIMKDSDLGQLQRLNHDNILALEEIVGVDSDGLVLKDAPTMKELRKKGYLWAQHVLESPRSWILCAIYILSTVIIGIPPVTTISKAAGLEEDSPCVYIALAADAFIYLFLGQIFTLLIRLVQGRTLLHRFAGRSVVIGDCPWVAQSAEAFLSKIFACSYAIAGVNVWSGNPADHLVHRMTHRVVRGGLVAVGRPDGRLSALTSLENSICLSVNQASSIASLGTGCESLTIGHNPSALNLCKHSIFLPGKRPEFLCERLLRETLSGVVQEPDSPTTPKTPTTPTSQLARVSAHIAGGDDMAKTRYTVTDEDLPVLPTKSSSALLIEYENLAEENHVDTEGANRFIYRLDNVIEERERKTRLHEVIQGIDGAIDFDTFAKACFESGKRLPMRVLKKLFNAFDAEGTGRINTVQCQQVLAMDSSELAKFFVKVTESLMHETLAKKSKETYFGEDMRAIAPDGTSFNTFVDSQELLMRLYESRFASLQRAVSFFVMFHEMGKRVADFWPSVSFGLLGYRMDRSHSIMRIATTASPVSGADVRSMMMQLSCETEWKTVNSRMSGWQQNWRKNSTKTDRMQSTASLRSNFLNPTIEEGKTFFDIDEASKNSLPKEFSIKSKSTTDETIPTQSTASIDVDEVSWIAEEYQMPSSDQLLLFSPRGPADGSGSCTRVDI